MGTKATIATHTLVLIGAMLMILFFTLIILWQWIGVTEKEATKGACLKKLMNYCVSWSLSDFDPSKQPSWDKTNPAGCENLKEPITEPTAEACKNLSPIK